MKHETLEKLYAAVKAKRDEPMEYDFWLSDDTANKLIAEAGTPKLEKGTLILPFDNGDVALEVSGTLCAGDEDVEYYYVRVLYIGDVYVQSKEHTEKKDCVCL